MIIHSIGKRSSKEKIKNDFYTHQMMIKFRNWNPWSQLNLMSSWEIAFTSAIEKKKSQKEMENHAKTNMH